MTRLLHIPTGEFVSFLGYSIMSYTFIIEDSMCYTLENKNYNSIIHRVLAGKSGRILESTANIYVKSEVELELIYD